MDRLTGKLINGWKIQECIKYDSLMCVYRVCSDSNPEDKYCLAIKLDQTSEDVITDKKLLEDAMEININVKPTFTYYDNHCFPIVPLNSASGTYEEHDYFVFERVSKTLRSVVTDKSLRVSRDDLLNIALQILEILRHIFNQNCILKNLHIDDFFLRRTTKGYRVVLLNQDFFTKDSLVIDDITFASVSVIRENDPTMRDNVVSFIYIMLYLLNSSLPWMGKTDEEIVSMKTDEDLLEGLFGDDDRVFMEMLKKYSIHSDRMPLLEEYMRALHTMTTEKSVTFGKTLSKYAKKKKVPSPEQIMEKAEVTQPEEVIQPEVTQPEEVIQPEVTQPEEVIQPEVTQPEEVIQPEVTQPEEVIQPEVTQPEEIIQPEVTQPEEVIQPEVTQPEEALPMKEEIVKECNPSGVSIASINLPKITVEKRVACSSDGDSYASKRLCTPTICKKSLNSDIRHFASSATFSNFIFASGVIIASIMGL